jgi:hypothetical protein
MVKKWCCEQFESHASEVPSQDGCRVALVWGKNYFLALLEFRLKDKQPTDLSQGGLRILFCPWCGQNLEQQYAASD